MTVFTDKAKVYIPRLMKDLNITQVQACGIFGNLGTETGGFTALQEIKPTVSGSKGGLGWMQWTGMKLPNGRRVKFENWCQINKLNPMSDEANYRYLVKETLTDEIHSLDQLRKTTTVEAATETFMALNLRPGKPNLPSRLSYAKQAQLAMQDVKKDTATTGALVGPVIGGAIATAATPVNYWPWIIGGTIVAIIVAAVGVHIYHEKKKHEIVMAPVAVKKGTKND